MSEEDKKNHHLRISDSKTSAGSLTNFCFSFLLHL